MRDIAAELIEPVANEFARLAILTDPIASRTTNTAVIVPYVNGNAIMLKPNLLTGRPLILLRIL